jgi:hypothetical protein
MRHILEHIPGGSSLYVHGDGMVGEALESWQDVEPHIERNKLEQTGAAQFNPLRGAGRPVTRMPAALYDKFNIETNGVFMKMTARDKLAYIKRRHLDGSLNHFIIGRI